MAPAHQRATLDGGVLTITGDYPSSGGEGVPSPAGTPKPNDLITLTYDASRNELVVGNDVFGAHPPECRDDAVNPLRVIHCPASLISVIRINAGIGTDRVTADVPAPIEADLGEGVDSFKGGVEADTVLGGTGTDKAELGGGNDSASMGSDSDKVFLGAGDDSASLGGGSDKAYLGGGSDEAKMGGGSDQAFGGGGGDTIKGNGGSDKLYGEGGPDSLFGAGGADQLFGGGGNDDCVAGPGSGKTASC